MLLPDACLLLHGQKRSKHLFIPSSIHDEEACQYEKEHKPKVIWVSEALDQRATSVDLFTPPSTQEERLLASTGLLIAASCGDAFPNHQPLFEANQCVLLASDGCSGEHARGVLEGGCRDPTGSL
jgi:hypothetical protein